MLQEIESYHSSLSPTDQEIAILLHQVISQHLADAENKIWHRHPVWFLEGNPIVGYSTRKNGMNLMFWSGQSFNEPLLQKEGKFQAAEIRYTTAKVINTADIKRWLDKARDIQWDYKNLVKRKGVLERLK